MFTGYVSFYCITVQIMQFPVLDFELDQYGSEPFVCSTICSVVSPNFTMQVFFVQGYFEERFHALHVCYKY